MKKFTKILSVMLCICMVLTVVSVPVFAADDTLVVNRPVYIFKTNDTYAPSWEPKDIVYASVSVENKSTAEDVEAYFLLVQYDSNGNMLGVGTKAFTVPKAVKNGETLTTGENLARIKLENNADIEKSKAFLWYNGTLKPITNVVDKTYDLTGDKMEGSITGIKIDGKDVTREFDYDSQTKTYKLKDNADWENMLVESVEGVPGSDTAVGTSYTKSDDGLTLTATITAKNLISGKLTDYKVILTHSPITDASKSGIVGKLNGETVTVLTDSDFSTDTSDTPYYNVPFLAIKSINPTLVTNNAVATSDVFVTTTKYGPGYLRKNFGGFRDSDGNAITNKKVATLAQWTGDTNMWVSKAKKESNGSWTLYYQTQEDNGNAVYVNENDGTDKYTLKNDAFYKWDKDTSTWSDTASTEAFESTWISGTNVYATQTGAGLNVAINALSDELAYLEGCDYFLFDNSTVEPGTSGEKTLLTIGLTKDACVTVIGNKAAAYADGYEKIEKTGIVTAYQNTGTPRNYNYAYKKAFKAGKVEIKNIGNYAGDSTNPPIIVISPLTEFTLPADTPIASDKTGVVKNIKSINGMTQDEFVTWVNNYKGWTGEEALTKGTKTNNYKFVLDGFDLTHNFAAERALTAAGGADLSAIYRFDKSNAHNKDYTAEDYAAFCKGTYFSVGTWQYNTSPERRIVFADAAAGFDGCVTFPANPLNDGNGTGNSSGDDWRRQALWSNKYTDNTTAFSKAVGMIPVLTFEANEACDVFILTPKALDDGEISAIGYTGGETAASALAERVAERNESNVYDHSKTDSAFCEMTYMYKRTYDKGDTVEIWNNLDNMHIVVVRPKN